MPGLLDFMLYCLYNSNFKHENLGTKASTAAICNSGIWVIERYRRAMKKALLDTKYRDRAPEHIDEIAKGASTVLRSDIQPARAGSLPAK